MTLVADENIDGPIVHRLRELGHAVVWIAEIDPAIKDPEVLKRAFSAKSLLLTKDKDFGDLVFRMRFDSTGVLLLRMQSFDLMTIAERIDILLRSTTADLTQKFSVMTDANIRIKPLPKTM